MEIIVGLADLPQILITWGIFFGTGLVLLGAGYMRNRRSILAKEFLHDHFPFNLRSSKSVRMDVKIYAIGKLTDFLWGAPGDLLSAALSLAVLGALDRFWSTRQHDSQIVTLAVVGVVLFLTIELADFAKHYSEHKFPILWELHKVHHSADSLNPLTSKREHPFSIALAGIVRALFVCVPAGAAMHFAGLSLIEIFAARALVVKACALLTLEPLRHSPYPVNFGWLDRLFISPHMHQVHHSSLQPHWDKNFGTNLSLYDWLFRTGYKPVKDEPIQLGISGHGPAELASYYSLYGAYVSPLLKAWGKVVRPPNEVGALNSAAPNEGTISA